jgi:hypothetical protein
MNPIELIGLAARVLPEEPGANTAITRAEHDSP